MSSWRDLQQFGGAFISTSEAETWGAVCFCGGAGALSGWCMFFKPVFNCQFPVKACFFSSCLKAFACLPLFGWLNIKATTTYSERLNAVERLFKPDAPQTVKTAPWG